MTKYYLHTLTYLGLCAATMSACIIGDSPNDPKDSDDPWDDNLEPRALHEFESCEDLVSFARAYTQEMLDQNPGWTNDNSSNAENTTGSSSDDEASDEGGDSGDSEPPSNPSDPDHSGTNVQVAGVDEPDILKTDGNRILALARDDDDWQWRLHYVDTLAPIPSLAGSLIIPSDFEYGNTEMFLHGNRVLLISRTSIHAVPEAYRPEEWKSKTSRPHTMTHISEIDISNPAAMRLVKNLYLAGDYVNSRLVGSTARFVLRSQPVGLDLHPWWEFVSGDCPGDGADHNDSVGADPGDEGWPSQGTAADDDEPSGEEPPGDTGEAGTDEGMPEEPVDPDAGGAKAPLDHIVFRQDGQPKSSDLCEEIQKAAKEAVFEHNQAVLNHATERNWLPQYVLEDWSTGQSVVSTGLVSSCERSLRPGARSGFELLSVVSLDLNGELTVGDGVSVFAKADTIYGNAERIYVAAHPWNEWDGDVPEVDVAEPNDGGRVDRALDPDRPLTYIHKFDLSQPQIQYAASGVVDGSLLSQWSLSEHNGDLRVAATRFWNGSDDFQQDNFVSVLRQNGSELSEVGQVGGLGLGERIYAVRFMGDVGYVVTFRQVDPLYTIDFSIPEQPVMRGELKVNGYSSYLHPIGPGLLLGVGQDATDQGEILGLQASIFDVSNLDQPIRIQQLVINNSQSEVEWDHRAFLYWDPSKMAVIPLRSWGDWDEETQTEIPPFFGATVLNIDPLAGISERGRIEHETCADFDCDYRAMLNRSAVVGPNLYTLSNLGIKVSSIDSLLDVVWLPFNK